MTITPSGMDPDASHVTFWVVARGRGNGAFELAPGSDSICDDGWYDLTNRIFLTKYH